MRDEERERYAKMNKINKVVKAASGAFAGFFALSATAATEIGSAAEFVTAINDNPAGDYVLTADIDLTDAGYTRPACFSGRLDGRGHTISGLATQFCLTNAGTLVSVTFDGTKDGAVRKLSGAPVGAISLYAEAAVYTNVIVKGYSLSTGRSISGLFTANAKGAMRFVRCATASDCVIEKGSNNNNISGGFIGVISGLTTVDAVFECCTNNATMSKCGNGNSSNATAGFVAQASGGNVTAAGYPSLRFKNCVNNGEITCTGGNGNISGFVGITYLSTAGAGTGTFRIVLTDCLNYGKMDDSSYAVSTASGFIANLGSGVTFYLTNCVNRADIGGTGVDQASGFVGSMSQHICTKADAKSVFVNCANFGAVNGKRSGGLFVTSATGSGMLSANVPSFYNCANYGTITGSTAAGEFAAEVTTYISMAMKNCYSATDAFVGKCTGKCTTENMHGPYEADYNAAVVCTNLSAGAEAQGWDRWWRIGSVSGKPELLQWSGDKVVVCTVRYFDWDGTLFKVREVEKGEPDNPPANPERTGYVFTGWDKQITIVTEDIDVTATYREREEGEIGCVADFISDLANDPAGSYYLANDINLADRGFTTVSAFSGKLDGAGFVLKGVGKQALFGTLSGEVVNLDLNGEGATITDFSGGDVGALCNICDGGMVSNCVVRNYTLKDGKHNSDQGAGAFAGLVRLGRFFNCEAASDVTCSDGYNNVNAGGLVGRIGNVAATQSTGEIVRFVNCTNRAQVVSTGSDNNSGHGMGGFVGTIVLNTSVASDQPFVLFKSCANISKVSTKVVRAAGFVGYEVRNGYGSGKLIFENCENDGTIFYDGLSITTYGEAGGFVAKLGGATDALFSGCVNRGEIAFGQRGSVGGFLGYNGLRLDVAVPSLIFTNCANYADVTGTRAGGFAAMLDGNSYAHVNGFRIVNCANYGTITGPTNAAEFVAYASYVTGQLVEMNNLFSMTTNATDYLTFSANQSKAILTNFVSAADEGYAAGSARRKLTTVAKTKVGCETWILGKLEDARVVPEIKPFCTKPYVSGLCLSLR